MAKKKEEKPAEVVGGAETQTPLATEATVSENPAKASKTEVTVKYRDHKGEPTERTFSKDVHGEDFAKLADEFKATNATRLIE